MKGMINMKHFLILSLILLLAGRPIAGQTGDPPSRVWVADQGDGTYKNPVLHADYSDPDVIRVGTDYFMTASSFNCVPGLPVLHSKDLVNWKLIGHALHRLTPEEEFSMVRHGKGVWAPCIRYRNNEFYIYFPDPDRGIFLTRAVNPAGPWSEPVLVAGGKGLIDPSPFWDDDGKAYLVYAFAGSRAGIKSVLMVDRMTPDGTRLFGQPVMVFNGAGENPTVEGPKFYKRNGWYYIFAPAGGVTNGWQLVLRSRNVWGPYEAKTIMAQGSTEINGPHQGGWVNTPSGEFWFLHFQDKEAYGRVVHLNPMQWINDWPVIGIDNDGDGCGEPVSTHAKPDVGRTYPLSTPPEDDEFNGPDQGLQWQWHANPSILWGFPTGNLGYYKLNCIPRPDGAKNLWDIPNLLMQKFPAERFSATVKMRFDARHDGEEAGLLIMGQDYQFVSLKRENGTLHIRTVRCNNAERGTPEELLFSEKTLSLEIWFRVTVAPGATCTFSYSTNGEDFIQAGPPFQAKPGKWIGAKAGIFALREGTTNDAGGAELDWFRITR
ncbi:MAG: Beta-xylosidase [Bacteroidetes bacterium ADurb.Bin123]|jgi:beta-xylosidase|nr:MAG: Beta-xylosidase [Bacteroidetes bacterium ADurb.Bin123]